jgi:hypothetical protein
MAFAATKENAHFVAAGRKPSGLSATHRAACAAPLLTFVGACLHHEDARNITLPAVFT